jgi:hypothetical protein
VFFSYFAGLRSILPLHTAPRDASKQNLAEKDGCLKTKNLAKTILVPLERGANEVRHENQTGDL